MNLGTWLEKSANVRGVITSVLLVMFLGVLMTFIVNPSALNPEKNQVISVIIGVLIGELKNAISFYFTQADKQQEAEKSPSPSSEADSLEGL